MKNKIFLIYILFLAFVSCAKAENFKLTENGRSNSTIIIQKDASKEIIKSAERLQYYIEKISDCKIPILNDEKDAIGILIYIYNKNDISKEIHPETCYIESKNNSIHLFGNNNAATAYTVYTFIENQLGVRWFAPGEEWEYIPFSKSKDIQISLNSYSVKPDISPRFWSSHNYSKEWDMWNTYNKTINMEGKTAPWRSFQNNIFKIFPPEKYAKQHPEYYPLIGGKRRVPAKDDKYWWPCIGNKNVQRITIEYINFYFKNNSSATSFSLGMDDIYTMCECELCRSMDYSTPANKALSYTDRYYKFINIVAKEVKKTNPDKYIGSLIYLHTKESPKSINYIENNVFAYMTQDWAKWTDNSIMDNDKKQTKEWKKYIDHISRYNYIGFKSVAPRFFPHSLDYAIKYDNSDSIEGMYSEIYTFLPHTAPMIWAFSKLQWNTQLNIDELLDEFYIKMYGNAHKEMKEYYDLLESCWNTPKEKFTKDVHNNPFQQASVMTTEDLEKGLNILNIALLKTKNTQEKKRINIVKDGLVFYSFYVKEYSLLKEILSIKIKDKSDADKIYSLIDKFTNLVNERHSFWNKTFQQKNILGINASAFNKNNSLESDIFRIESLVLTPFVNLIDWHKQNRSDNSINRKTTNLIDNFPESSLKQSLVAYQKFLNVNHSESNLRTIKKNTINNNILGEKWTTWSRVQLAEFKTETANNKSKEYFINSTQRRDETGIHLQNINNLTPETSYIAKVMVKTTSEHSENVTLGLRLRSKNKWYSSNTEIISIKTTATPYNEWQPLIVAITLPKGADGISFQMSANNAIAQFKDPELFKVD